MNRLGQNAVLRARVGVLSLVTIGILAGRPPLRLTMALGTLAMALGGMEVAAAVAARRRASLGEARSQGPLAA